MIPIVTTSTHNSILLLSDSIAGPLQHEVSVADKILRLFHSEITYSLVLVSCLDYGPVFKVNFRQKFLFILQIILSQIDLILA